MKLHRHDTFNKINEAEEVQQSDREVRISIKFEDADDQETFEETYGLNKSNSNFAAGNVKVEDLPQMIEDLQNVYGIGVLPDGKDALIIKNYGGRD